ncbi:MAG: fatty acyl-AMP ligase [Alphaproteobacteria bacterium]|nr:fatty acyl-AMP ligase [Alphaproteobacteria bacterium]
MPETIGDHLDRAAALDRPGTGLRFLDRHEQPTLLPWPEVLGRAERAAGALVARGIAPGERVAIVLPTGPAFFDAYFGCQLAGAVPVPLYPPVRLGRLDEYVDRTVAMLQATSAVALVSEPRVARVLGRVLERARPRLGLIDAATLATGAPHRADVGPDQLAMVQFSSGTTVDPKAVALTHRQVLANASRILDVILATTPLDGDPSASGVSWLPLYHDMGLIGCVFPALMAPGPLTLIPPEVFLARPAVWLRALSTYRGTVSPAPDFAYALCVERVRDEDLEGVDLSTWKMALDGAEPIAPATLAAFAQRFGPHGFDPAAIMPVYGLSEASLAVTFTPVGRGPRVERFDRDALACDGAARLDPDGLRVVSVGPPLPDYAIRIVRDGVAVAEGNVGRIHVRGPSVMQGYLDRHDQPFVDGWLDTGDLGFLRDGELFVTGRAKDVIVHRGRNHAPQELERAVDAVPGVRTGCSVAVADVGEDGERVLVFAEVRERTEGQAQAVVQAVKAATGITPDLAVLLDPGTLPRTSSGKLRRSETLARWRAGTLTPPRAVTPWMLAGALADSFLGHLSHLTGRVRRAS